jgi:hypothetical protein
MDSALFYGYVAEKNKFCRVFPVLGQNFDDNIERVASEVYGVICSSSSK